MQPAVFLIFLATAVYGMMSDEEYYKDRNHALVMRYMIDDLRTLGSVVDPNADPFLDVENELRKYETEIDLAGMKKIGSMFKNTLFKYKNELCLGPVRTELELCKKALGAQRVFLIRFDFIISGSDHELLEKELCSSTARNTLQNTTKTLELEDTF
ncbi:unnamed protein product [Nippostrongylus brasiliensis]|uniref:Secreted protein n=1 Tax=Nippostrongylus brasiliensis TaxID=27835 RepID=A0A0N4XW08_NIPBR|nr:unnamed protein product [Nippostrongylus brasiliensis]